jgi:hypothetical protein
MRDLNGTEYPFHPLHSLTKKISIYLSLSIFFNVLSISLSLYLFPFFSLSFQKSCCKTQVNKSSKKENGGGAFVS